MKKYRHSSYPYVSIIEIDRDEILKIDFAACNEPRETLGSFYNRQEKKPKVLMNAGFFGMVNGVPVFNLIDEGKVRSEDSRYNYGMGTVKSKTNELKYGNIKERNTWSDFISGYPVLLDGNGPISKFTYAEEINYNACRSCLGMNDTTIFCVHIGRPGMMFKEMSIMLYNIGCTYAINLDGGGSSRMLLDGDLYCYPTEDRAVDSVLAIYFKEDSVKDAFGYDTRYELYTAVKGDSWWSIAQKKLGDGRKYKELMEFNEAELMIRVGQQIKIPIKEYLYTVKAGDSWWSIAQKEMGSGTKYMKLVEYNDASASDMIYVGQILRIPV